jgi:retron-type reverse transcriptase
MLDLSNKRSLYRIYPIKKDNGKVRIIQAPCDGLKKAQKELSRKLESFVVSEHCYGFKKGSCASHAAVMHTGKKWIIKLDIKDFFPSIKKSMLTFLNDYEKELATLNDRLTQGSPCSPIISNIVLFEFDQFLHLELQKLGVAYSRYADDITISGKDAPSWELVHLVSAELSKRGFRVNHSKVRFLFENGRQNVLGIVVNDKLSVDRRTRHTLRAKIHQDNLNASDHGMLAFINSVSVEQFERLTDGPRALRSC